MNQEPRTKNKLRLAYFGTPYFAADFLEKLLSDSDIPVEVVLVVTQPDRKVGRKQILTPTPVKVVAEKHNIQVVTIEKWDMGSGKLEKEVGSENHHTSHINNPASHLSHLISKTDLGLLHAYGEILPKELLEKPKYGFWNVHPSLLPLYRGPAPMATPLIEGQKETGVTLIKMDEQMDHGPIIAQEKIEINSKDRRPDMEKKLTELGYEMFKNVISNAMRNPQEISHFARYRPVPGFVRDDNFTPQEHSKATYTERLTKDDGYVEISNFKFQISNSPEALFNRFRGLYPWPGIWSKIRIKNQELRIKITDMDLENGKLVIKKVQLEGKNEVDWKTFNRAYQILPES